MDGARSLHREGAPPAESIQAPLPMSSAGSAAPELRIAGTDRARRCKEAEVYSKYLPLVGSRVLELGCGGAEQTVAIAGAAKGVSITALEVDRIQHEKNLSKRNLPNVSFKLGGAEAIPEAEESFDIVLMFKSLHHVPVALLEQALLEVHRVLRPGGFAYISEPVFAGAFNDIIRLFHDEEAVRRAAFEAVCAAVKAGLFEVVEEIFFEAPLKFDDFADFEKKIIRATHNEHRLSASVHAEVKRRMEGHATDSGIRFQAPMRVDLLRKPA